MGQLTEYAIDALREVSEIRVLSEHLIRMLEATEAQLAARARKYTDERPVTNARYNQMASRLQGTWMLSRSVDIYNWYNRSVLKLVIETQPETAESFDDGQVPWRKKIEQARRQGADLAKTVLEHLDTAGARDGQVRYVVHKHLGIYEQPETSLICTCRNVVVHSRGKDVRGDVQKELAALGDKRTDIHPVEYPPGFMPIFVAGDSLVLDYRIGGWALRMIENQIHLMDQHVAHKFKLPTQRWRPRPISFNTEGS